MPRITLLTDFGTADGYAAAMRGVIASIAPEAVVEDVAHDIPPGDLEAAAWALWRYWDLYPPGTVHLVVVDPGVGGARRAIAAGAGERLLVAPDNGVLTRVLEAAPATVVSLQERRYQRPRLSATFHGRDLFAPAAAHLAAGVALDALGPRLTDPVKLRLPAYSLTEEGAVGSVVHVDRFGTLVTSIPGDRASAGTVRVAGRDLGPVRRTFGDVASGEPLALVGSAELIEIAVRDGSAAACLGVGRGAEVRIGGPSAPAG